jgi:mono/diheme cytochrome c family protein
MKIQVSCTILLVLLANRSASAGPADAVEFFESKIRPLLANNCFICHGPKMQMVGLDLSTASGFFKGSDNGPVVIKGDPENSRFIQAVGYQGKIKMPPAGKLQDQQIDDLRDWVRMGAPWPASVAAADVAAGNAREPHEPAEREFWAFRPVKKVVPPAVRNSSWIKTPVDHFILAKLEEKGIDPASHAGKLALLRRATFGLTGLPPTEQEIEEFLTDSSPDAFSKVVDRLLTSPRYGECWGRHWLDVARFAESTGADEDRRYPYAWRYRDYVIDSFNRDLPYDQFIMEQVAGDLLPAMKSGEVNINGVVATGFLALGPKPIAQQDKVKMVYDVVDEQIDVMSKAFLALTISCARCHDHKFDPISSKDYYSLASIFASTRSFKKIEGTVSQFYVEPLVSRSVYQKYEACQKKIGARMMEIDWIREEEAAGYARRLSSRMADYMVAAWKVYEQGASPAELASEQGLDLAVLERWVGYLRPDGEVKPHLARWRAVQESLLTATAKDYQDQFQIMAKEWQNALADWKSKIEAARESHTEIPEKPKFDGGKDRLFSELAFGSVDPGNGKIVRPGPLALPERSPEQLFSAESRERLAALRQDVEELKKASPPEPPMACAVAEGQSITQRIFMRGNHDTQGEEVPKGVPQILVEQQPFDLRQGSGRLELAKWLADPKNPLTARVMANRLWQWHFGEGLVRTPSNYGKMGLRPTHPELLDYLAGRFIESGWSIKAMHRLLMLSNTYQMSSQVTREKAEADPSNELWSHFNRRRLTVEEIRDSFLGLDGTLDLTMGGSLQTYNDTEDGNERPSFSLPQTKRRTVYLPLRRSNLFSLLNLFDFGDATSSSDGRTRSNVAPQALFMMNSDFMSERSRCFAEFLLKGKSIDESQRIQQAYRIALSRSPTAQEIQNAIQYITRFPAKAAGREAYLDGWQSFCQILIASNEFIYVD